MFDGKRPFVARQSGLLGFERLQFQAGVHRVRHRMPAGHTFRHVLVVGETARRHWLCSGDEETDCRRPHRHRIPREVVLAAERQGAMARSTGVEVDAAVIEEAAKAAPAG